MNSLLLGIQKFFLGLYLAFKKAFKFQRVYNTIKSQFLVPDEKDGKTVYRVKGDFYNYNFWNFDRVFLIALKIHFSGSVATLSKIMVKLLNTSKQLDELRSDSYFSPSSRKGISKLIELTNDLIIDVELKMASIEHPRLSDITSFDSDYILDVLLSDGYAKTDKSGKYHLSEETPYVFLADFVWYLNKRKLLKEKYVNENEFEKFGLIITRLFNCTPSRSTDRMQEFRKLNSKHSIPKKRELYFDSLLENHTNKNLV
ncbi:hypothetical protein [Ekhidna sp.]|uniref:hypothetical protein n=1 Tax=Ekhidna sp. TaxID=2608089 RepID=UPI003296AB29